MSDDEGQVVSANDLFEGDVVYLNVEGGWTRALEDAAVAANQGAAAELLGIAAAHGDRIVGPYLVNVLKSKSAIEPSHIREKLRVSGPSILSCQSKTATSTELEVNHVSI